MNDFDKLLFPFMLSAGGIILGWILNQTGQWLRTRQDDKKSLKQVLYNLLETYHWFLRCDFDGFTKMVTNKVFEKFPEEAKTPESYKILEFYINKMGDYQKQEVVAQLKKVEESYQSSIATLAGIDPVTAFYLSGKTAILDGLERIEEIYSDIKGANPSEIEQINFAANKTLGIIKPAILKEEQESIEDEIISLAWKINPVMWYKAKKTVSQMKENMDVEVETKIEELFSELQQLYQPASSKN